MNQSLVSVIIPTYNREHLIVDCVEGVLNQTYSSTEIIVIDDGSTDNTKQVLDQFSEKITYIFQENSGQAVARKKGLELAEGEYFALLDSDDLWEPTFLETCISGLKATGAAMFFTNYKKTDRDGTVISSNCFETDRPWLETYKGEELENGLYHLGEQATHRLFTTNFPPACSASVFRSKYVIHYPDPNARMGDDYLFFMDYALSSPITIAFTSKVLWCLRIHGTNIRQQQVDYHKIGTNDVYIKSEVLRKHGHSLSANERRRFKVSLAEEYFNWGYSASEDGKCLTAIQKYLKSFVIAPSPKALMAIPKSILKLLY